jgi:acyl-CoA synthetase (AMP-forming)/AMP-acid ligase II
MDVRGLSRRSAQFHRTQEAIVHGDRRIDFAEAWQRAVRLANGLLALGLAPGDRVGVLEANSVGAADTFTGLAVANLVRVPLYPRNSLDAHRWMLGHTDCRVLIADENHAETARVVAGSMPGLQVLVRDERYEDWLDAQDDTDPDPAVTPEDPYVIRHTGGTTGRAKGVAYSHRSWLAAGRDWFYLFPPVLVGDRCLHVGPISHGSGYFFTPMWLHGGVNVLLDQFDAETTLDVLEREEISYAFMVPTMLSAIARHPSARRRDLSRLKVLQVGGAPITDDTARRAHEVFGDVLFQGYGQTEAVPVTMMGPEEWFGSVQGSQPLRSAGRPLPFADLEIRDDAGAAVPAGVEGEIVVRCDGQMTGFWEDPAASAARMRDGWVATGDIGRIDGNGYVYVLDRLDDMIISGGFNIWPAELENVLASHPAVLEVAVFGVPDERWGETPHAVVVVDDPAAVDTDELVARCARELGSYKKPAHIEVRTEALPRSPVGKVLRKALREPHWRDHERRVSGT